MKVKLVLIFSLFFGLLNSVFAGGVGGNGGGPSIKAKYEEAYICDGGESGTICHKIRFRIRKKEIRQQLEECWYDTGEAGLQPCTLEVNSVTLDH